MERFVVESISESIIIVIFRVVHAFSEVAPLQSKIAGIKRQKSELFFTKKIIKIGQKLAK